MSARVGVVRVPRHELRARRRARGRAPRRRRPSCSGTATAPSRGVDAVVVPGGFAHGDYLRTGAIARFSPVMDAVAELRRRRRPGRRHLQRLPGAHRGRAAPRRAAEERGAQVPVRHRRAAGSRRRRSVLTDRRRRRRRAAAPDQPLRGQLRLRRRRRSTGCAPTTASCCATSTTRTAASTTSPGSATRPATSSG